MKQIEKKELDNMSNSRPTTLGELKATSYESMSIKDELRKNLVEKLKKGEKVFEGIHGYEDTVIPQVERAILSGHNINFLGLRGQAKTMMARLMTNLLDEYVPAIEGSDLNDDPLQPISAKAKRIIEDLGDKTPIVWIHRSERYYEKLATPDVTVADLIGDIDPIKAANLKLSYADEEVIHYGMIPRANRSIFVINELPDLQARIQVALFNILQEGDVQIRGFKLRLNLDIQFVFTANPEDYTNRGSIVTPLKDRIGSQILTHYPEDIKTARKITEQEAKVKADQYESIALTGIALDLIEQIAIEARNNEFIDAKSGVSARLGISALENLMSTAERRLLISGAKKTSVRLIDFYGLIPSLTGKMELAYEGEQEGSGIVAENLIAKAANSLLEDYLPGMGELKLSDEKNAYNKLIRWFAQGDSIEILEDYTEKEYHAELDKIPALTEIIEEHQKQASPEEKYFLKELVLWSLAENSKLNKESIKNGLNFTDLFSSYLNGTIEG